MKRLDVLEMIKNGTADELVESGKSDSDILRKDVKSDVSRMMSKANNAFDELEEQLVQARSVLDGAMDECRDIGDERLYGKVESIYTEVLYLISHLGPLPKSLNAASSKLKKL